MPEQLYAELLELCLGQCGQQVRIYRIALEAIGVLAEPLHLEPAANRNHLPLRDTLPGDTDESDSNVAAVTVSADPELLQNLLSCLTYAARPASCWKTQRPALALVHRAVSYKIRPTIPLHDPRSAILRSMPWHRPAPASVAYSRAQVDRSKPVLTSPPPPMARI